jgi:hypothetical protein
MFVHRLSKAAKGVLPSGVFKVLRSMGTGVLTPFVFSYQSGHINSSLKGRAVDKEGKPLPWYTYPAIELLGNKDFTGRSVVEFGAGQSTLWWSGRAEQVLSFEDDFLWYGWLKSRVPANVRLMFTANGVADVDEHLSNQQFDVAVIDGLDRFACAQKALNVITNDGAIVLDNSDGFWGQNGSYPIIDLFRDHGFSRVDFYGHAPGVILPACTSIFFKSSCFLLKGTENPSRRVT